VDPCGQGLAHVDHGSRCRQAREERRDDVGHRRLRRKQAQRDLVGRCQAAHQRGRTIGPADEVASQG
jgi:hypothetical protein